MQSAIRLYMAILLLGIGSAAQAEASVFLKCEGTNKWMEESRDLSENSH